MRAFSMCACVLACVHAYVHASVHSCLNATTSVRAFAWCADMYCVCMLSYRRKKMREASMGPLFLGCCAGCLCTGVNKRKLHSSASAPLPSQSSIVRRRSPSGHCAAAGLLPCASSANPSTALARAARSRMAERATPAVQSDCSIWRHPCPK